jgi:subtilisin family serine protease
MSYKSLSLLTIFLIFVALSNLSFVSSAITNNFSISVDAYLVEQINSEGKAQAIIEYIHPSQELSIAGINPSEIKSKNEMREINLLELQDLKNNPQIKNIIYNYPVKLQEQKSMSLINTPLAWNLKTSDLKNDPQNIAGMGQTICIVDSGVDYTHPDLGRCYGENNPNSSCKVIGGYDFINDDSDPLDDNGHGTHVAGIAAANGVIKGVAPDAKIVSIKVLNSQGEGTVYQTAQGISWCVDHASEFNITSISISLGVDCSDFPTLCSASFCDEEAGGLLGWGEPIARAVENNISVIVSSGNDGKLDLIAPPSCLSKVIAVGASDENDLLWEKTNRNSILQLLAPGTNIYSTWLSNSYSTRQGTSMSAPHVSATVALINQYLLSIGERATPLEIRGILNKTGKLVYESLTNSNFARVDSYNALLSLDKDAPKIKEIYHYSKENSTFLNLKCEINDWQINNAQIKVFNQTSLVYFQEKNLSGNSGEITLQIQDLSNSLTWQCISQDKVGNKIEGKNFTIQNKDIISLNPISQETTYSKTNLSCYTSLQNNLTSLTLQVFNQTSLVYFQEKNLSGNYNTLDENFEFSIPHSGIFNWNCIAQDSNLNNFSSPLNATIIKKEFPLVQAVVPRSSSSSSSQRSSKSISSSSSNNSTLQIPAKINPPYKNTSLNVSTSPLQNQKVVAFDNENPASEKNISNNQNQGSSSPITGAVIGSTNNKIALGVIIITCLFMIIIFLKIYISRAKK